MIESTRIHVAQVASHYDDLDPFYRRVWGRHVHHGYFRTGRESVDEATRALVNLMLERAPLARGADVVDVGCGYGETARVIATEHHARVTGYTISARQHAFASTLDRDATNPRYVLGDWLTNTLPDQYADFVYAIESSEHMPDFDRFFAEAARVLKPGGHLAIFAWLEGQHRDGWRRRHLLQALCDEGRMRLARRDEYEARLGAHGLTLTSFDDLSASVSRTWTICIRRALKHLVTDSELRRYALSRASRNRDFALSLVRIRLAFATGAMRYGLFVAEKS